MKRFARFPYSCFRHPTTGALVRHPDNQDAEMLNWACQVSAGLDTPITRRVIEMNHQSAQNRARIQRRVLGEERVEQEVPVEFRDLWGNRPVGEK